MTTLTHYSASSPAGRQAETERVIANVRATIAPADQAQALRDLKRGADGEPQLDEDMLGVVADQIARLDREIDELQVKTNAAIAALHEPSRGVSEVVARHDAIDRLFKRMDRLTRERFGYDPKPAAETTR